jgi:hypothetical protein
VDTPTTTTLATETTTADPSTTTTQLTQVSGPPTPHSWLHNNVRPLIVLLLGIGVVYMAVYLRLEIAQAALATSFVSFANHLFTERTALKVPGRDS